ncbi:MAG TPA: hypothetical protein VHL57_00620 [Flavobacteriales bacterium]|jgi:hypothetical protein|nr:hypothetical protein [Flavobacteriales bacterium]
MPGALLAAGYTALFLFLIRRWGFFAARGLSRRSIGLLFLLKIAAGTVLWYIYTYHYPDRATADIYKYFDDGNIMFGALPDHPGDYLRMLFGVDNTAKHMDTDYYMVMNNWYRQYEGNLYNDAHTMIRFNALVRLFSFGVYHVHTVFACFLGLIGLVGLYRAFVPYLAGAERALAVGVFLLPSVLFWGSGVIKEALLFFALGVFVLHVFRSINGRQSVLGLFALVLSVALLAVLKFYVVLSLAPGLIAYTWCRRTGDRRTWMKFGLVYVVAVLFALTSSRIIPGFDVLETLWVKQKDFVGVATATGSGSYIPPPPLEPEPWSFIKQIPHALYMTFLSPLVTWRSGALGIVSAAENVLLLLACAFTLVRPRHRRDMDLPLILFCVGYCLVLALIIGWTTPVVGALVRYRVPLLPFGCIALLLMADPRKWPRWIGAPLLP